MLIGINFTVLFDTVHLNRQGGIVSQPKKKLVARHLNTLRSCFFSFSTESIYHNSKDSNISLYNVVEIYLPVHWEY